MIGGLSGVDTAASLQRAQALRMLSDEAWDPAPVPEYPAGRESLTRHCLVGVYDVFLGGTYSRSQPAFAARLARSMSPPYSWQPSRR
jgi:hypothetical protein